MLGEMAKGSFRRGWTGLVKQREGGMGGGGDVGEGGTGCGAATGGTLLSQSSALFSERLLHPKPSAHPSLPQPPSHMLLYMYYIFPRPSPTWT